MRELKGYPTPPRLAGPRPVRSRDRSPPQTALPGVHPWLKNQPQPTHAPRSSFRVFRLFRGSIQNHRAPKSLPICVHTWLKNQHQPRAVASPSLSSVSSVFSVVPSKITTPPNPPPNPCSSVVIRGHPWLKKTSMPAAVDSSICATTHAVAWRLCEFVPPRDLGLASEAIT